MNTVAQQSASQPSLPYELDMLVIGSGPAGQHAAIQAAKLGKRVGIIERRAVIGGVCVNTGTIPSKTIREAILFLSGYRQHEIYGESFVVKHNVTVEDLNQYAGYVIRHELDVKQKQLQQNGVQVIYGTASLKDAHTVRVESAEGAGEREISTQFLVIATGTEPTRDDSIPFDGRSILCSDDIIRMDRLPKTLAVVGGGVIGCEYASMFATLGVRVTLIDRSPHLLPFVDKEIVEALQFYLRDHEVTLWLDEEVKSIERVEGNQALGEDDCVRLHLASGKTVHSDKVLYSIGRTASTAQLNLAAAGLEADSRGRLQVNANYQTQVPHIYAAGDVIGFPSLASTSMEQGRVAASHAFGVETRSVPEHFPYGIYTIPEISYVGQNEQELTKQAIPYEVGKAHYREISRGLIIGETHGVLKLIFDPSTKRLLGVHIIGEDASDLVHIGQAVMSLEGTIDYFIQTVFNYPTLAEGYKIAALNGLNRLNG